jgi:hypothetical protein
VPDVGEYRTLKCDFHLHSVFSDGLVWPTVRVREAYRQGLDAISITDHDDYHPHAKFVSDDLTSPYEIARPEAESLGVILIPGMEITKGEWHFNALFLENRNVTKSLDKRDALIAAKKEGAFVFWNHPGWKRPEQWFPEIDVLWDSQLFSGVELVNGPTFYEGIYHEIVPRNLAIISNTDWHEPAPENNLENRAITLVFAKTADPAGIREALEARRTAAWMGGQVWGAENWLRGLWEGAVKASPGEFRVSPKGQRNLTLTLTNNSSFKFDLRVARKPDWLAVPDGRLTALGATGLRLSAAADAPAGRHDAALTLEVLNFHTGPGRNLEVTLPLRVTIGAAE